MTGLKQRFWVLVALPVASTLIVPGWGADPSSPTSSNIFVQPVLPQNSFGPNFLNYNNFGTRLPGSDYSFSPGPRVPTAEKGGMSFDFKTDREVEIEKLLPTDKSLDRPTVTNGNLQKKKIPFMGLSITKPLN
jgi:hypothetical protein